MIQMVFENLRNWRAGERGLAFLAAAGGTGLATALFWLARGSLDKGQASLLYLPVVLACAVRFGFGAAVVGALLSFVFWDFFFLPPRYTLAVANPRDWLPLVIFLVAALTTARLAARARGQAEEARARERETLTLYQASEAISGEVEAARLLPALAGRIARSCGADRCVILRRLPSGALVPAAQAGDALGPDDAARIGALAGAACEADQAIGFGETRHLWAKALGGLAESGPGASGLGASLPLRMKGALVGALHVGPRRDGRPFSGRDQRLISALASHAAVIIARQSLAEEAAQAAALREADALKDALLSMVTHELRTPLAAIRAAASGLVQRGAVWPEADREAALRGIDREADRLSALVSNLLDLSRLEGGAWRPAKEWCDLAEIAGTALDRLPEEDAARVRLDAAPDLPLIRADYVQIALVLTNLLQNAAKYAPDGPIFLTLRSWRLPGGGEGADAARDGVRADVRDSGEGVAPGDEEAVFARFHRSARHAGGIVHGTGLGLALCRAVTQAHGGRIWATNAPAGEAGGATFSFFLPIE